MRPNTKVSTARNKYYTDVQCQHGRQELYLRHPSEPGMQCSREVEEQQRDECEEDDGKGQSDGT